ncbi:MAG: ATP-binding cassette domain-containing protein [Verrucomicrobia bacterium]|nr:ATP-binding cassette domain-containing protein [Verrucomicrobiota bacterium]
MKPDRSTTVLAVSDLNIRRGTTSILRNLSWRVKRGEHWVILGANGSGKTSLLSALTAYLTPTAGTIELLGQRYGHANWPELRRKIGLVSSSIRQWMAEDEPALQTVVSGKYAVIDYWGKITAADRGRARRILAGIECGYLADRAWGYLSQGERQRVLIGRALMAEPHVLILDEPCAGLDPAAREHFLQFLDRLGRRPRAPTLILVTHHVEEIMPVFSHVLILKEGEVLVGGKKNAVLNSSRLSKAFAAHIRLRQANGRYGMSVARRDQRIL